MSNRAEITRFDARYFLRFQEMTEQSVVDPINDSASLISKKSDESVDVFDTPTTSPSRSTTHPVTPTSSPTRIMAPPGSPSLKSPDSAYKMVTASIDNTMASVTTPKAAATGIAMDPFTTPMATATGGAPDPFMTSGRALIEAPASVSTPMAAAKGIAPDSSMTPDTFKTPAAAVPVATRAPGIQFSKLTGPVIKQTPATKFAGHRIIWCGQLPANIESVEKLLKRDHQVEMVYSIHSVDQGLHLLPHLINNKRAPTRYEFPENAPFASTNIGSGKLNKKLPITAIIVNIGYKEEELAIMHDAAMAGLEEGGHGVPWLFIDINNAGAPGQAGSGNKMVKKVKVALDMLVLTGKLGKDGIYKF